MKSTRRKPRVKNQRGLVTLTLLATVLSAVALDRYPHGFAWCFLTWSAVSLLACLASRPPRVGWLYVAVLLAALGAVEIVWSLEDASREELARSLEWEVVGEDYMISRKSVLGYELVPGSRGRTVRRHPNGELIYDVVYTIDDNGLRVSPGVDPDVAAKAIVFFGGSYTFGEGVADDETLPARTGLLLGGRFAICNFALHGYGPHQMLAALEHDLVAARLEHAPAYGIYQLLPAHIERSAGPASWDSWGPRYHVDDRGRVTFQGSFAETRQQPANSLLDRLSSLAGKSKIAQRVAPVIGARRETRLFLAIVGAARDRFESSYPGSEFHVLFWDTGRRAPELHAALLERGHRVHLVSTVLPQDGRPPDFWKIPGDGHPSAAAYDVIARYLVDFLIEPKRKTVPTGGI